MEVLGSGAFVEEGADKVERLALGSYHYQGPVEDMAAYYGVSYVLGALVACINQAGLWLVLKC